MGKSNYPYHPGRAKKQQNKSRGIRKIIFLIILIALAFAAYKLVICNNSEQNSSPNNQHGQSTEQDVHTIEKIDGTELPAYSGTPYVKVNDNFPNFAAKELTTNSFEGYGKLDTYVFCKCKFLKFADKNGEFCISVLEKVAGCPAGLPDAS